MSSEQERLRTALAARDERERIALSKAGQLAQLAAERDQRGAENLAPLAREQNAKAAARALADRTQAQLNRANRNH